MDNQLENTGLNETIVENQVADVVIQKDLPYMSVQEMFNTPEYDAYIDSADVAEMQQSFKQSCAAEVWCGINTLVCQGVMDG